MKCCYFVFSVITTKTKYCTVLSSILSTDKFHKGAAVNIIKKYSNVLWGNEQK